MFHFHILLLGIFLGSTEASCRARPPGLDQNLTTVGPIIDDPQLATTTEGSTILTTTVPEGNHTCLIPYLYNTEFDALHIAKDIIFPTSVPCTRANLYYEMEDSKIWSLEGGEKYEFYGSEMTEKTVKGA
ncbi:unnamed protein product [Caenorhabditis nigoni]